MVDRLSKLERENALLSRKMEKLEKGLKKENKAPSFEASWYKSIKQPLYNYLLDDLEKTIEGLIAGKKVEEIMELVDEAPEPDLGLCIDDRREILSIDKLFQWIRHVIIPYKYINQQKADHHYYTEIDLYRNCNDPEEKCRLLLKILCSIKREKIINKKNEDNKVNQTI